MTQLFFLLLLCVQTTNEKDNVGLFAKTLWFLQEFGEPKCSSPQYDRKIKSVLAKAIANDRELALNELDGLMNANSFARFSGPDNRISENEFDTALSAVVPSTRMRLEPDLRKHAELLTTSFDMIEHDHLQAVDKLAEWIANNGQSRSSLHVVTTCTGNSRRSILGAAMGNLAAAYYGFENVRFHSGGTMPTAFNKRTVATCLEFGILLEHNQRLIGIDIPIKQMESHATMRAPR